MLKTVEFALEVITFHNPQLFHRTYPPADAMLNGKFAPLCFRSATVAKISCSPLSAVKICEVNCCYQTELRAESDCAFYRACPSFACCSGTTLSFLFPVRSPLGLRVSNSQRLCFSNDRSFRCRHAAMLAVGLRLLRKGCGYFGSASRIGSLRARPDGGPFAADVKNESTGALPTEKKAIWNVPKATSFIGRQAQGKRPLKERKLSAVKLERCNRFDK